MRLALPLLAAAAVLALAASATATEAPVATGRAVFQRVCAPCHAK